MGLANDVTALRAEDLCAEGRPGRPAGVALLKLAGDKIVCYMNMLHLHPVRKFKLHVTKLLVAAKLFFCVGERSVTGTETLKVVKVRS